MSKYFNEFIKIVLNFEGGYVDHPSDPGGATNYGISLRFMRLTEDLKLFDINRDGIIDKEDVKLLTKSIAIEAYKKYFWDFYNLDKYKPRVSLILFDMYVNHRPIDVNKMLQKSLNRIGHNLKVDGVVGPMTRKAVNSSNSDELSEKLLIEREDFYHNLVKNNPSQVVFLNGWLNHRVNKLREISLQYKEN